MQVQRAHRRRADSITASLILPGQVQSEVTECVFAAQGKRKEVLLDYNKEAAAGEPGGDRAIGDAEDD